MCGVRYKKDTSKIYDKALNKLQSDKFNIPYKINDHSCLNTTMNMVHGRYFRYYGPYITWLRP